MNGQLSALKNLLLMATLAVVLCGCFRSATKVDSLGVKVGDRLQLVTEAVMYRCQEATSMATMWFNTKNSPACLKAKSDITRGYDHDVHAYGGSHTLDVVQIKYWNGIDADGYMMKLKDERDGHEYWAGDLEAPDLFGLRRTR